MGGLRASGWVSEWGRLALRCRASRLTNGLDIERELDFVADQETAGLEHLVPVEAEQLAIDRAARCERDALIAPRVCCGAEILDREGDVVGDAADRELA